MATQAAVSVTSVTPVQLAIATEQSRRLRWVCRWAWATLAFFVIVVLEGAVVRATSSGAGCGAHWPLCNGEILPHHPRVATMIEFAHRSLTGVSSMMFVALLVSTFLVTSKRHPARRAAVVAAVLLLTEGALGAMLVLRHLVEKNTSGERVLAQSVHFTNTMLLLAATTVTAVLLGQVRGEAGHLKSLRLPALLALGATLLTGATGSLAALADTIFPSDGLRAALAADFAGGSPLLIRMRWMHPAASGLAVLATLLLIAAMRRMGDGQAARLLLWNLGAQVVIGVLDVILLAPTWIQVLHLFSADVFWISLVVVAVPLLFARALRRVAPATV